MSTFPQKHKTRSPFFLFDLFRFDALCLFRLLGNLVILRFATELSHQFLELTLQKQKNHYLQIFPPLCPPNLGNNKWTRQILSQKVTFFRRPCEFDDSTETKNGGKKKKLTPEITRTKWASRVRESTESTVELRLSTCNEWIPKSKAGSRFLSRLRSTAPCRIGTQSAPFRSPPQSEQEDSVTSKMRTKRKIKKKKKVSNFWNWDFDHFHGIWSLSCSINLLLQEEAECKQQHLYHNKQHSNVPQIIASFTEVNVSWIEHDRQNQKRAESVQIHRGPPPKNFILSIFYKHRYHHSL